MGWRFNKSISELLGVRLTMPPRVISTSVGVGPRRISNSSHGSATTARIPGTGLWYRRPLVVGRAVRSFLYLKGVPKNFQFVMAVSLVLGACGAPMIWNKPGATRDDFSSARYACMQQSQQRVSETSINALGGYSSSAVVTNEDLFGSCMNANGWYLTQQANLAPSAAVAQPAPWQRTQPPKPPEKTQADKLRESGQTYQVAMTTMCARPEYANLMTKTPCKLSDMTAAHLSNLRKISTGEASAMRQMLTEIESLNSKASSDIYLYGQARGTAMQTALDSRNKKNSDAARALIDGRISWGEFNTRRQQALEAFRSEMDRIANTVY